MPPASAPTVQSLQDLVGQYTAAQAPENQQIDNNVATNEASGTAQTQGLNAAKDAAFGKIDQTANNKGMFFSGFTPSQEATYTGSTYLPALAKVQAAIANVRNTLMGQKANLATTANTNALSTQKGEQTALDQWNTQQTTLAAEEKRQQEAEAATAAENEKNRQNSLAIASSKAANTITPQQAKQNTVNAIKAGLGRVAGTDTFVAPQDYAKAYQDWLTAGYGAGEFNNFFSNFKNPHNGYYDFAMGVKPSSSATNSYGL